MAMTLKVQDIIRDAMGLIGAIAKDELPTPDEYKLCLRVLNAMLGKWSSERLMLRSTIEENFPITSSASSYTIGPSATFNTSKPISIIRAFIRDVSGLDFQLDVVNKSVFNLISDKSIVSGRPSTLIYNPGTTQGASQGTIQVYTKPDTNYTLYIDSDKYLTEFSTITSNVTFEPCYYEALIYNLATRIFRHFQKPDKQIPVDIVAQAKNSKTLIKSINTRRPISVTDLPGIGGNYNITSDSWD